MTQEDNNLLIKDLCARLPYEVKVLYDGQVKTVQYIEPLYYEVKLLDAENYTVSLSDIKPYLRPLSSMTEEERKEYQSLCELHIDHDADDNSIYYYFDTIESFDWLNKKMFDYREPELISADLALEAPEGMYN